jgi:hypothetical protein
MMCSMFKYEQKNKFIKRLIKNQRFPISSIVKNHLISESCSFLVGLNFDKDKRMQKIFCNKKMKKRISKTMEAILKLRYDSNKNTISWAADEETVLKDHDEPTVEILKGSVDPKDPYSFEIIRFLLDLPKL